MANITIQRGGTMVGATSDYDVLRALAQQNARTLTAAVTNLTNNSGGTAASSIAAHATVANAAASGSSLADKTTTEAALNTVLNGFAELLAKANTTADTLGIAQITDTSGATAADGTLGAITVSVTGAATGVVATTTDTTLDALDEMQYNVALLINKLAKATGVTPLTISYTGTMVDEIAALTVSGGTAADPGITKVAMDAILVTYRSHIKAMATTLDSINTAADPYVLAV